MKAYVISDIDVTDPEIFESYKTASAGSLQMHGGRFLVRGGDVAVIEGDWSPARLAVLEFESVEKARRWIESAEYAQARGIRQKSARTRMVLVAGTS